MKENSFTVGVEEEYLLVDVETGLLADDPPKELVEICNSKTDAGNVYPELQKAQIEVSTKICSSMSELRDSLAELRTVIADNTKDCGLAPIAASTHPLAEWRKYSHTDKERYHKITNELQVVAHRFFVSGTHMHVGIENKELRIDLMNQAIYFLPYLLALSTSSPFWQGHNTFHKSYRVSAFSEWPRAGLPDYFHSFADYESNVQKFISTGIIEDSTKIWWDLRPHDKYPTLETRICDVCTDINDSVAITALNMCIMRMLFRMKQNNQKWRIYNRMLIKENKWRAQRYGIDEGFIDVGRDEIVPFAELLENIIEMVMDEAKKMGCEKEVLHTMEIVKRGTSAHWQVETYEQAIKDGATEEVAFKAVIDMLRERTIRF